LEEKKFQQVSGPFLEFSRYFRS